MTTDGVVGVADIFLYLDTHLLFLFWKPTPYFYSGNQLLSVEFGNWKCKKMRFLPVLAIDFLGKVVPAEKALRRRFSILNRKPLFVCSF